MIELVRKQLNFLRRRISAAKEIREQLRLRASLEKRSFRRLETLFRRWTLIAADQIDKSRYVQLSIMRGMRDEMLTVMRLHYRETMRMIFERNESMYSKAATETFVFGRITLDNLVMEYLEGRRPLLTGVSSVIARKIGVVIGEARAEGLALQEISKRIRETIPSFSRIRAALISRTETHNAASWANDRYHTALAGELDIEMMKRWVSVSDGRTRPEHRAANGQTVEIDEKFTLGHPVLGEVKVEYPGDPAGTVYHVVNCRCVVAYGAQEDFEE